MNHPSIYHKPPTTDPVRHTPHGREGREGYRCEEKETNLAEATTIDQMITANTVSLLVKRQRAQKVVCLSGLHLLVFHLGEWACGDIQALPTSSSLSTVPFLRELSCADDVYSPLAHCSAQPLQSSKSLRQLILTSFIMAFE